MGEHLWLCRLVSAVTNLVWARGGEIHSSLCLPSHVLMQLLRFPCLAQMSPESQTHPSKYMLGISPWMPPEEPYTQHGFIIFLPNLFLPHVPYPRYMALAHKAKNSEEAEQSSFPDLPHPVWQILPPPLQPQLQTQLQTWSWPHYFSSHLVCHAPCLLSLNLSPCCHSILIMSCHRSEPYHSFPLPTGQSPNSSKCLGRSYLGQTPNLLSHIFVSCQIHQLFLAALPLLMQWPQCGIPESRAPPWKLVWYPDKVDRSLPWASQSSMLTPTMLISSYVSLIPLELQSLKAKIASYWILYLQSPAKHCDNPL